MSVEPFTLPLQEPLATARGTLTERRGFLVRVEQRGSVGIGEATPLPGWTESLETCLEATRTALSRIGTGDVDGGLATLSRSDVPAARHGVALALLDARARRAGRPLARLLAEGPRNQVVPVNATVGSGDVHSTVRTARRAVRAGFRCLKVKVGGRPLPADVARVRAVREAVGAAVTLRVDANGAWDLPEARAALAALEPLGVSYVEQPLPAAELSGLASLAGGPVAVAVDESLSEWGIDRVLDRVDTSAVVLKPMVLGGVEAAFDVATRCLDADVDPVVTTTVDAAVARTAAVHLAAAIPDVDFCGLATATMLARDVAPDPAPVTRGEIRVPDTPGVGIDPGEVDP